jgi:2-methylcitrate dehydratase PrpD
MLYLVTTHDVRPDDVEFIMCDLQPEKPTYRYLYPQTDLEAKYSLGYGIAMCLMDRKLTTEQYGTERILDPKTAEILSKIKHTPQSSEPEKHKVSIVMKNGNRYSHMTEYSKGHAIHSPLSDQELIEKFRSCADGVLTHDQVERFLELISAMEKVDDIALIVSTLKKHLN